MVVRLHSGKCGDGVAGLPAQHDENLPNRIGEVRKDTRVRRIWIQDRAFGHVLEWKRLSPLFVTSIQQ